MYFFILAGLFFLAGCSGKNSAEFNKLLEQGRAKINSSSPDYTGALNDLNQAQKLNPKSAEVYYWIGRVYMATENIPFPKTIQNYNKAISINPDYALAYCSLAAVYDRIQDRDKACQTATKSMAAFEKKGIKTEEQAVYEQAKMLKEINCK